MFDEFFLPVEQPELLTDTGIFYRRGIGFIESSQQHMHARLEEAILFRRHEARAQHGTQWALAKVKPTLPLLSLQLRLGRSRQVIRQEIVIPLNGFT